MKRLLYIFPTLNPGGAEKVAIQISNYLIEKYAYKITYFVYDDSNYYKPIINKNINIIQYGHQHRYSSKILWWYYYYINIGFALITSVRSTDYDVIISVHEQVPEIASVWLWAYNLFFGKNIKKKIISVISTSLVGVHDDRTHMSSRVLFTILKNIRRYTFGTVVVLSKSVLRNIQNYHTYIIVIPNPIDFKYLKQSTQGHNIILHRQKPYLLFVASVTAHKNPLLLLQAYEKVYNVIKYNLIMIGHISDKNVYREINDFINEKKIGKRIIILSPVDNLYLFIANAKGVVLVSNYEGMPMILLEAMALKVPIITTRYEGCEEYFDDTIATLIEKNSVEELSATLLECEQKYMKFKNKTKKAFQYCQEFSIDNIGEKYHQLFMSKKE
jgi:glycosyltransferase involved in cell wall biosynthesis